MPISDLQLRRKSLQYRRQILEIIYRAKAGHTGGSLSCVDILNVLYNRVLRVTPGTFSSPDRDRYIQSKGHSVEGLFVVLADQGFFPFEELATLCGYGSRFAGHPTRDVPGVEQNTGALGHGLAIGIGCAIGAKKDGKGFRSFVLMGDGELAEGSVWEAAMAAAHYRLNNLVAIIDHNGLQITGPTREVCSHEPLAEKWKAFGWEVATVDGHDLKALEQVLSAGSRGDRPLAVIANTIKGRGISFMENVASWHHGVPDPAQYAMAIKELELAERQLEGAQA